MTLKKKHRLFFPQSTPQSYVLLLLFGGASASLFSVAVSVTHRAAYQLTPLAPLGLPFSGISALCLLAPLRCATACCSPAHSPPPLAAHPPAVTPLPCIAPVSFGWLLHFPAPQPLHHIMPPPGALASAIHHASTFCCTLLVWLVVALPSASPPILLRCLLLLVRDSAWHHPPLLLQPYPSRTMSPSKEQEQGLPKHCCFPC